MPMREGFHIQFECDHPEHVDAYPPGHSDMQDFEEPAYGTAGKGGYRAYRSAVIKVMTEELGWKRKRNGDWICPACQALTSTGGGNG